MPTNRKPVFTSLLPSTPVMPEMREQIVAISDSRGVSLAEVQREAFSLFLQNFYSKAIDDSSVTVEGGDQDEQRQSA